MSASPIAVLAGLCGLQAAVLAGLWFTPDGRLRDAARWQEPPRLAADRAGGGAGRAAPGPFASADAAALRARPLFSMTRRPPAPAAAAPAEAAPDRLSGARVRAIVEGPDAVSSAILDIDGKSRRILKHQAVEGWTLESLSTRDRTVTLIRDGRRRVLALQRGRMTADARPRPAPAVPAPAAAAAPPR